MSGRRTHVAARPRRASSPTRSPNSAPRSTSPTDFPTEVLAEADAAASADAAARGRPPRPRRSSRSTPPARWTSTRRCTSSAATRRIPRALRDRGCPGLRARRRRRRPRGPRARADAVRRRRPGAAASAGAERGPGLAPARRRPQRLRLDVRARRGGRGVRAPHLERALGALARAAQLPRGAGARSTRTASDPLDLLREVGLARIEQERARGGASLNVPDEEIVRTADGYTLRAATTAAGRGVERPALAHDRDGGRASSCSRRASASCARCRSRPTTRSRRSARRPRRSDTPGPSRSAYGEYLRGLDRDDPAALAIMQAAGGLFRGAGYEAMDGEAPADPEQSALAAPYAHVTAPLRRLVDRWGLVVCEALSAGQEVPRWARDSLHDLPSLMGASSQRASRARRRVGRARRGRGPLRPRRRAVHGDGAGAPRRRTP